VSTRVNPVGYLYLDGSGIEGLYAQTVDRLQIEYSTTVEKALSGRIGAVARLQNLLIKFLGGPEIEITGDISGSRKKTEQSKQLQSPEQRLTSLIAALDRVGEPTIYSDVAKATRQADLGRNTVFLCAEDEFNAPQFYSSDGITSVNSEGYLLLEKGGAGDYDDRDDYYKRQLNRVVKMSASILKMPGSSNGMAMTGHDAILLRGFRGRAVPLGVFGLLTATPGYFQIKPYAIWRR